MGVFQVLVVIATGIALTILPTTTGQEKSLGTLPKCGHELGGEVIVKNEREVIIKGFHYDGTGPAAWFHAMRKGATGGIYTSDDSYYITLPFPEDKCDIVHGKNYNGTEDVTLILPVSIKKLETIGMLCYKYCHNFGYVNIPHDLDVPAAPAGLLETQPCPRPTHTSCTPKGGSRPTKDGGPNCTPVGEGPSAPLPTDSPALGGTTSGASEEGGRVRFGNLLPGLLFLVIDAALRGVDG